MNITRYFVIVLFLSFANFSQAEDYAYDCDACGYQAVASSFAELKGYGYAEGLHTVFVVNMDIPTVWQVDIFVLDIPDPFFEFGTKNVTVLSITNAPPETEAALQAWKDIGITAIFHPPTIDFVVDLSNNGNVGALCPTAGAGTCSAVSAALFNLDETQAYITAAGILEDVTNRLYAFIMGDVWFPLRFIVIFPDLSIEIYEFKSIGQAGGIQAVESTAATANGSAISPGGGAGASLQGWGDYATVTSGISHVTSTTCTTAITQVVDPDGTVSKVTITTQCQ